MYCFAGFNHLNQLVETCEITVLEAVLPRLPWPVVVDFTVTRGIEGRIDRVRNEISHERNGTLLTFVGNNVQKRPRSVAKR